MPDKRDAWERAREAGQRVVDEVWAGMVQGRRKAEVAAAQADPQAHKLTTVFDGELRWRYYSAGTMRGGHRVTFGWSTTKNAAGFYLTWREVVYVTGKRQGTGKRDQFAARRKRTAAKAIALRRSVAFQARKGGA